tara:strand:+ start:358 stop:486 length:129 start_codon:yes stop_codon:yes gene_type:complete
MGWEFWLIIGIVVVVVRWYTRHCIVVNIDTGSVRIEERQEDE